MVSFTLSIMSPCCFVDSILEHLSISAGSLAINAARSSSAVLEFELADKTAVVANRDHCRFEFIEVAVEKTFSQQSRHATPAKLPARRC